MFVFDDENDDSQLSLSSTETTYHQDSDCANAVTESAAAEPDMPLPQLNSSQSIALTTDVPRTPGSIRRFAINLLNKPKHNEVVTREQRDVESQITESTRDLPEGTEPGSEPGEIVEVIHRRYEHCEGPTPAKRGSSNVKMPDTPPASPAKMLSVIQDTSPASTLSPVPSTLSDHGNDEGIKVRISLCPKTIRLTRIDQGYGCHTKHPKPACHANKEERLNDAWRCTKSHQSVKEGLCKQVQPAKAEGEKCRRVHAA